MTNRQFAILLIVLLVFFGGFGLHAGLGTVYLGGGGGLLLVIILILLLT